MSRGLRSKRLRGEDARWSRGERIARLTSLTSDIKDERRNWIRLERCSPQSRANRKGIDITEFRQPLLLSLVTRHMTRTPVR